MFEKINLEAITTVQLTKIIRDSEHPKMPLAAALKAAKLVKEAHRLGVIRGQVVQNIPKRNSVN